MKVPRLCETPLLLRLFTTYIPSLSPLTLNMLSFAKALFTTSPCRVSNKKHVASTFFASGGNFTLFPSHFNHRAFPNSPRFMTSKVEFSCVGVLSLPYQSMEVTAKYKGCSSSSPSKASPFSIFLAEIKFLASVTSTG